MMIVRRFLVLQRGDGWILKSGDKEHGSFKEREDAVREAISSSIRLNAIYCERICDIRVMSEVRQGEFRTEWTSPLFRMLRDRCLSDACPACSAATGGGGARSSEFRPSGIAG